MYIGKSREWVRKALFTRKKRAGFMYIEKRKEWVKKYIHMEE